MKEKNLWKEWTNCEIDFLKDNYPKLLAKDIASLLGRSCKAIQAKAWGLGIQKLRGRTYEEIYGKERAMKIRNKLSDAQKERFKKTPQWCTGKKRSKKFRKKRSEYMLNPENNPSKRLKVRRKLSKIMMGRKITWADKISATKKKLYSEGKLVSPMKGKHLSEEAKEQIRKKAIKNWKDPEFRKKMYEGMNNHPNPSEKRLIDIIENFNFPFKFVGDYRLLIGKLNPDFIDERNKRIIELFGEPFHKPNGRFFTGKDTATEKGRIKYFRNYGYKCLIIWYEELKNTKLVVQKIKDFIMRVDKHEIF